MNNSWGGGLQCQTYTLGHWGSILKNKKRKELYQAITKVNRNFHSPRNPLNGQLALKRFRYSGLFYSKKNSHKRYKKCGRRGTKSCFGEGSPINAVNFKKKYKY